MTSFLSRELHAAQVDRVAGAPAVLQSLRSGQVQVAAGIRQVLEAWAREDASLAGAARPLHGDPAGMGLPAGHGDAAADALAGFVERMKSSGFVAGTLARHGVGDASVAPG